MPTNLDHKILTGFTQEAQSYLPKIREGIESFLHDTQQKAALEAACQHVHAIKGASEMLELACPEPGDLVHPGDARKDGGRTRPGGANTRSLLTPCRQPA